MKIWNSYGSEHSANLVMIGTFKTVESAEKAKAAIDALVTFVNESGEDYNNATRFSAKQRELYRKEEIGGVASLAPQEFFQFCLDVPLEQKGAKIEIRTDEMDVSAYLKVFIDHGAKLEIYSAHDYPDTKVEEPKTER